MEVSIIIPTYRDWPRLAKCLEALSVQTFPFDLFEILIANNDPADSVPSDFYIPRNARIIDVSQPGSYSARNAALSEAKGEIIGFTDSDCIPEKDWISNAITYFREHPDVSRIGGKVDLFYQHVAPNNIELYDRFFAFNQKRYVEENGTAVTANMFTYARNFQTVGLFDQSLMSGGDFHWGANAAKQNIKIGYADNVVVKHPARETISELVKKEKRVGEGQAQFLAKTNYVSSLAAFLKTFIPRPGEIKYVLFDGNDASIVDRVRVTFLRYYLLIVRAFAKYQATK